MSVILLKQDSDTDVFPDFFRFIQSNYSLEHMQMPGSDL